MWAVIQGGRVEIVKLLLQHHPDLTVKTHRGQTALMIAKQEGNVDIIKLLREAGASK